MSKYYELFKHFWTFFVILCSYPSYTNQHDNSIKTLSEGFVRLINGYAKFNNRKIKLSDNNIFYFEDISAIFSSDPPYINAKEQTIDYFNAQVNFIFNLKLQIDPINKKSWDILSKKNITIVEKKSTILIKFPRFHISRNSDNSFEYDHYMFPTHQEHNFGQIEEYDYFKNLINEFGEYNLNTQLSQMWFDYLHEILTIYPICDSLSTFRQVKKYIQQSGNFSINYSEEPGFKWIYFKTVRYKGIEQEYPYSRKILSISFEIEYFFDCTFRTSVYFDYIIFSQKSVLFGTMFPPDLILEKNIQLIFQRALKIVLDNENNK